MKTGPIDWSFFEEEAHNRLRLLTGNGRSKMLKTLKIAALHQSQARASR